MSETLTLSDRVKAIQAAHGGEFEREPLADGTVVVRLKQPTGEVVAGRGATTADAVGSLERRVEAFAAALAAGA